LRDRQHHILVAGHHGPDGTRGEVVRYPRALDYFRRSLARVTANTGADPGAGPGADMHAEDPAAKLLAMTQRLLAPDTTAEPDLLIPRSRA
jgi:hypothetical protein